MPDLEERIAAWRRQMIGAGISSPHVLDELESHLREEVERQMCSRASEPEAFAAAVARVGHATALKIEFEKAGETMDSSRRKYLWKGSALGAGLFVMGISLCYFFVLPLIMPANQQYAAWLGIETPHLWGTPYTSFVCKLLLGFGAAFALPAGLLTLVNIEILDYRRLVGLRRYVIVFNLVLGALLTTPEVVTQLLMFVPLQLIYEVSVSLAWYSQWKETKCT
ncbi:MAG TPA: twin-arginine translocase subunit TatC [Verrucomicrobiae bacterium]|jgi:hypothetical protein